jgi:TorA maturation chaperone TorD
VSAEPLAPEDHARANLYGLLARLFYAAPDAQLLSELQRAPAFEPAAREAAASGEKLACAWRELIESWSGASAALLESEHTELFVGTGRAEITPYLSHYVMLHASDNPLVGLRQQLARWGIARKASASEPEDHVAGVFDVMRFVIAVQQRTLDEQKDFFERFVYPGAAAFCDAVSASEKSRFYGAAARFARAFLDIERKALDIGT